MKLTEEAAHEEEMAKQRQRTAHSNNTMTDESSTLATDGGKIKDEELFLHITDESHTVSRYEQLNRIFDLYVYAPMAVAWNNWRARIGVLGILAFILVGTVGIMIVPEPVMNEGDQYIMAFQSWEFPLGTDAFGQSILKQLVHATPAMLQMVLAGAIVATGLATVIGTVAGYKGGKVDKILMTITDVVLTIPGLPLIIVIAAIYPPRSPFLVGILIAIDQWPGLARALRSQVLTIREESYVEAARAMGISPTETVRKHIVPQLMPYIAINAANAGRGVIFQSVGLYFLGILPFTTLNWGVVMNLAHQHGAMANPERAHWLYIPMFVIISVSFVMIMFSQGMDRVFNPRLRAKHAKTVGGDDD